VLIARARRSVLPIALALLSIGSLAACEWMLGRDPPAAFYLLPFRAYELLVGCLIALPGLRSPESRGLSALASAVGLAMIAAAVLTFTRGTRFPGLAALLPVVGTALVLWGSDRAPNPVSAALGTAPFAWVGRISYSLYLVHWPLIIFADRLFPYADVTIRGAATVALSIALAWLCFWAVEQPFRRGVTFWTRPRILRFAGVSLASLAAVAGFTTYSHGFPGWLVLGSRRRSKRPHTAR
jgi:peptidoglycan/LPS O-acetylase OafA/YrhL